LDPQTNKGELAAAKLRLSQSKFQRRRLNMAFALFVFATGVYVFRHARATRRLVPSDFRTEGNLLAHFRARDLSCDDAKVALGFALEGLRRVRIVDEAFEAEGSRVLLDVSPDLFSLDDFCGLGLVLILEPSRKHQEKSVLWLVGFAEAFGPGGSALTSFSSRLFRQCQASGIREFDPHR
jgi:hypothetical protein